jgi:hypothetical protein
VGWWRAQLAADGVFLTTPVALRNRLPFFPPDTLAQFDLAVFDEIDVFLSQEELRERVDLFPIVRFCLASGVGCVGFTGTALRREQVNAWERRGFALLEPEIPEEWLPFTRVEFVPVVDGGVEAEDQVIRDQLRVHLRQLAGYGAAPTWSQLRILARTGEPAAIAILQLIYQRLELFEDLAPGRAKRAKVTGRDLDQPTLLLTRFRLTAELLALALQHDGVLARYAHGGLDGAAIAANTAWFRIRNLDGALAITRELGGRGLDFPKAKTVLMISPRSNYQTVMQEFARIRGRKGNPKTVRVLYYERTAEEVKAARLAEHLGHQHYGQQALNEVVNSPVSSVQLESFEARNLRNEEALDLARL